MARSWMKGSEEGGCCTTNRKVRPRGEQKRQPGRGPRGKRGTILHARLPAAGALARSGAGTMLVMCAAACMAT